MLDDSWSHRKIDDLGRYAFARRLHGVVVEVDIYDGGGFVLTFAAYRVAGRVVALTEAGQT